MSLEMTYVSLCRGKQWKTNHRHAEIQPLRFQPLPHGPDDGDLSWVDGPTQSNICSIQKWWLSQLFQHLEEPQKIGDWFEDSRPIVVGSISVTICYPLIFWKPLVVSNVTPVARVDTDTALAEGSARQMSNVFEATAFFTLNVSANHDMSDSTIHGGCCQEIVETWPENLRCSSSTLRRTRCQTYHP